MLGMIVPVQNLILQSIKNEESGKAAATGTVEKPAAYVTADALGHFAAVEMEVETPWYESAVNWVSGIWKAKSDGGPACGRIAEGIDDFVPRSGDGGVPDAGDGGPDAADAGDGGLCVDNEPPGTFGTNQPMNGASDVSLRPTFGWTASGDPDGQTVTYTLMIDTNENFTSAVTYDASTLNQYTLANPLATDTTYYWRVEAKDPCDATTGSTPTPAFSFTTLADCSTNPGTFDLVDPADQANQVSLTPTFDWTDSLDIDPGDSVQYRLEISTDAQFTSPTVYSGLTDSTYTLNAGEALANGQIYYWRVFAEDDCQNEIASTNTYEFSTEPACIPQTILETDFVTGDGTDVLVNAGSVSLDQAWTYRWDAASGLLPTETNPVWTLEAPNGGAANLTTDPVSNEPALYVNSIGADNLYRYVINPGFSNATGWVVQWRARVVSTEGSSSECSVEISDDIKLVRPGMNTNMIEEPIAAMTHSMDTTNSMHNYRITGHLDNYEIFADGASVITFSNGVNTGINVIMFPDNFGNPDSESYWRSLYYYDAGPNVPYLSPGEYVSSTYDLGANPNNLGSGATLVFNGSVLPSTNIVLETRSGNTAVPGGTWSSWQGLSGNQIQSPTARYLQIRSDLSTSDDTITPQLDDYTVDYCAY